MAEKIISAWKRTKFVGVRYREHPTRKHGINPDRYFSIRYRVDGKRREEGLGWGSQEWTAEKAAVVLADLKKNRVLGLEGPQTLSERRKLASEKRTAEQEQAQRQALERKTFVEFFEADYLPGARITTKPESYRKAQEHVKKWIGPVLGRFPMKDVRALHLEKIRFALVAAGRSPRTIQYVFATVRRVWNVARKKGLVSTESPTRNLTLPKVNNERQRFLRPSEADTLLAALERKNHQLFCMSLLAYHCGLRFSEVTALTWDRIDFEGNRIKVLNAKGHQDRAVPMTERVVTVLRDLGPGAGNELLFKNSLGGRIGKIMSKVFDSAVAEVGLNDGISDPKLKFTYHSLRHSYASGLVAAGVDLYTVQRLLGHKTPAMSQRYSHVADETLEAAVRAFEANQAPAEIQGSQVVNFNRTNGNGRSA